MSGRNVKAVLVIGAVLLFVAGVAGCGGDDSGGDNTSAATSTTQETTTTESTKPSTGAAKSFDVSLSDFKIDPPNPRIKAGLVSFKVKNDGATPHNLEVEGPAGEVELPSNLVPGQTGTLNVDLKKPGKYEWYCPVGEHRKFGMKGEITVSGGSS